MKKSLLLLVAGAISLSAGAQNARHSTSDGTAGSFAKKRVTVPAVDKTNAAARGHAAERTTSTCTFTENFSTGTYVTLPTGWTAGTLSGPGTWHWANTASSSMYSIGAIHSTTASNGWMIFDSDSLAGGTGTGTVVPSGWLQSPAYSCSALSTVRLTFEEYYEKFNDSTKIQVSTTPTFTAGTTTTYQIPLNQGLGTNDATANPATIHINISSAAAMQPIVYIRFVYYGPPAGGYSWMIDDICIGPLDAHDVGISGSFMFEGNCTSTTGAYDGSVFNTPLAYVDSFAPVTLLSNYGANPEPTVVVNAILYEGASSVFTPPASTYSGLPVNAYDSVVQFNPYLPTSVGSYSCVFNTTVTGDADATNNNDTVGFNVTDTTWQENYGSVDLGAGYYVYKVATPALSFFQGTRFDVPCGATPDTVSGFGVAFAGGTGASVPTTGSAKVSVQLYSIQKGVSTGWTYVGSSLARSITAANICVPPSTLVWCDFRIDQTGGVTPFILQPGNSYAAMIQINGVSTDLVVCTTPAPNATGYSGYFGQSDVSNNDGVGDFGASSIATGSESYVPMVIMYNGNVRLWPSGVQNVTSANSIGEAFPNPSNASFTVPVTMAQDSKVVVTLTDVLGQVISTQNVNAIGGQATSATFNTSNLSEGVYIYSVQANDGRTTGRVVVAH